MITLSTPIRLPAPTPEDVAAGLRRAAALLREGGWTRYLRKLSTGEHCALGAINEVAARSTTVIRLIDTSELVRQMSSAAARLLPELPESPYLDLVTAICPPEMREALLLRQRLVNFNDTLAESGNEVAVLFEQAAEKIEAGL